MKTSVPIKVDDFERVAAVLGPCELVKGEIISMSPGGINHGRVSAVIVSILMDFARRTKLGTVLTNEAGIVTEENPDTVRGADVVYISFKRLPKEQSPSGYLRAKPELVVEVLGQKDTWESLEEKVTEYHTFGVELVWVVDPNTQTVRIYPRNGQSFVAHGIDKIDGGKGLPGFQCQASEFFSF